MFYNQQMNQVVIKVIGNYSYQTSRCLGEGVYGKVYQGMQRQTKEKVAIKKIDLNIFTNDKYLQNAIFSQIYLLKRFNHPNIVRFKDVLSSKNSLYIITEFCKNGDLKQLIKRKRFKQEQAFEIMRQLLGGFSQLVRQKIIHRDLKPANILINEGVYKIGDFGFAKYVDNFGSQMLKSCVGSPIYMAPQILQRTQYTTKCDIWSLGIIFFQMIHGYPPWKARDQTQLLRSVKNNPINHLLKKTNLSQKGNQFLKRTLTFSEEQRISWNQLFQLFGNKVQKQKQKIQQEEPKSFVKEKQRVHSVNSHNIIANNINTSLPSNANPIIPPSNTINNQESLWKMENRSNTNTNSNTTNSSLSNLSNANTSVSSSPLINLQTPYSNSHNNISLSPQRNKNNSYYSNNQINIGHKAQSLQSHYSSNSGSNNKRTTQVQNVIQWRQLLVYYHFYCVQMLTNFCTIQNINIKPQLFGKLLYSVAIFVKNRSTFCLSMIVMHSKVNKNIDDIYKKMQNQQQSYQMTYSDIVSLLQRGGIYKNIRSEYSTLVGHNQVISQDRIQKIQNFMISSATENAQVLSEEVKKKVKTITNRDYSLVQALDNVLDILRLALGKNKSIKQIQEQQKQDDQDIKDYVARVFGKVDRLASSI